MCFPSANRRVLRRDDRGRFHKNRPNPLGARRGTMTPIRVLRLGWSSPSDPLLDLNDFGEIVPDRPSTKKIAGKYFAKKIAKKICEKNREKISRKKSRKKIAKKSWKFWLENKIFRNMKNTTRGRQNKPLHLTRTPYNAKWSSLHRPWISGTIEGRSGRGCFPFQNQSFWRFLNRPLIDTISNIKVRWGTIEDDNITTKNMHLFLYTREFPKNGLYFWG